MIIAPGRDDRVLEKVLAGESIGTLFQPERKAIRGRLRWIDSAAAVAGKLHVDAGAAGAVGRDGKSLLAIGILHVEGSFQRGEVVAMIGPDGVEIARGLINYSSDEAKRIVGLPSSKIAETLGTCPSRRRCSLRQHCHRRQHLVCRTFQIRVPPMNVLLKTPLLLCFITLALKAGAEQWPGCGPRGDGSSMETDLPESWNGATERTSSGDVICPAGDMVRRSFGAIEFSW
ncbi:MAG: PUA domain-containing protein [Pirellulaceae bacterium]